MEAICEQCAQAPAIHSPSRCAGCVVWLPPNGMSAEALQARFSPVADELLAVGVESEFVSAPTDHRDEEEGTAAGAWYRYLDEKRGSRDKLDVIESLIYLEARLGSVMRRHRVGAGRVFLAGLDEGGFVALESAYCFSQPFAGVICLDGDFPLSVSSWARSRWPIPALIGHGRAARRPIAWAHGSRPKLESMNFRPQWLEYDDMTQNWSCIEKSVRAFVVSCLHPAPTLQVFY